MNNSRTIKLVLAALTALTLILGLLLFVNPPGVFPDPSWGFQAMRSLQQGKGFNLLIGPSIANVNTTSYDFLSWWSPGQYLVPYIFICLFKLNIGQSVAIVVTLGSFLGIYGFFTFFKKIGFTPIIATLSVAFIFIQQAYFIPYVYYNGGEILIFAFTGWFLYGCIYFDKISLRQVAFVFFSGLIGFFCKSSFLWIYFAGSLYLWINVSLGQKWFNWAINGICTGLAAMLALAIIYLTYLSKGGNPSSGGDNLKLAWETFGFPLASPLLAAFSIDDLSGGILMHPIWILMLLGLASILLITYLLKIIPHKHYVLLLPVFYISAVLFFGINFLRQANISYEARHMRLLGILITPGIIHIISLLKVPYKAIFALVCLYLLYANYSYVLNGYKRNTYTSAHGSTGIAQEFIDQPGLNYIIELDKKENNAIFVFISPDLPLEISHNRTITFDPLEDGLTSENNFETYLGHAGPVHIVLPMSYMGTRAQLYMKCFTSYHNFTVCATSNDYLIYTAL